MTGEDATDATRAKSVGPGDIITPVYVPKPLIEWGPAHHRGHALAVDRPDEN